MRSFYQLCQSAALEAGRERQQLQVVPEMRFLSMSAGVICLWTDLFIWDAPKYPWPRSVVAAAKMT